MTEIEILTGILLFIGAGLSIGKYQSKKAMKTKSKDEK